MTGRRYSGGHSLLELVVTLAILSVVLTVLGSILVQNSKINKAQLMQAEVQTSARGTLSLIVQALRTAGWDPLNVGFAPVVLDSDLADAVNYVEAQADLNADGDVDDAGEAVTIRHSGRQVEWRLSNDGAAPYQVLGVNIDNDADGNGVPEVMFTPDSTPNPSRITVRVTATAPANDPTTGRKIQYTVSSDVLLRNSG